MRTRPFTAQPFASRIGPSVRWRSLSQEMSTEGPETTRTIAATAASFAHQGRRSMNPVTNPPSSVPRAPMPTPRAAMIPTIRPTSTGAGATGLPTVAVSVTRAAVVSTCSSEAFCFACAKRAT